MIPWPTPGQVAEDLLSGLTYAETAAKHNVKQSLIVSKMKSATRQGLYPARGDRRGKPYALTSLLKDLSLRAGKWNDMSRDMTHSEILYLVKSLDDQTSALDLFLRLLREDMKRSQDETK